MEEKQKTGATGLEPAASGVTDRVGGGAAGGRRTTNPALGRALRALRGRRIGPPRVARRGRLGHYRATATAFVRLLGARAARWRSKHGVNLRPALGCLAAQGLIDSSPRLVHCCGSVVRAAHAGCELAHATRPSVRIVGGRPRAPTSIRAGTLSTANTCSVRHATRRGTRTTAPWPGRSPSFGRARRGGRRFSPMRARPRRRGRDARRDARDGCDDHPGARANLRERITSTAVSPSRSRTAV